jgi:hypothetical protein
LEPCPNDLSAYPSDVELSKLFAIIDTSHDNDLHNKHSTAGYSSILMAGAAIAYHVKTQTIVTTSSIEAEFFTVVVHAGKVCGYVHSIFCKLGFPPSGPTIIYEDNQSTINIINNGKRTHT